MVQRQSRTSRRGAGTADNGARHTVGGDPASATVTVHVPLAFRQRGRRKVLVAPDGEGQPQPSTLMGSAEGDGLAPASIARSSQPARPGMAAAVRALARAFRWRRLLETGAVATVHDIAAAETINPSYVSRVLRLTLLAPDVVETIVEKAEDGNLPLNRLMLPFPVAWQDQMSLFLSDRLLGYPGNPLLEHALSEPRKAEKPA